MSRSGKGFGLTIFGLSMALLLRLLVREAIGAEQEGHIGRHLYLVLEQAVCAVPVFIGLTILVGERMPRRMAERLGRIATSRRFVAGCALVFTLAAFFIAWQVYGFHPITNGDEYAYVFQSELLASGRLHAPVPPHPTAFDALSRLTFNERWFALVFPGHPALLAPGLWVGWPWLSVSVSSLLVLLTGAAIARRISGGVAAGCFAFLVASSPHVLFMQGSLLSQTSTTLFLLLLILAAVRLAERPSIFLTACAGIAWSALFLTRPPTAVTAGLVWLVWVAWGAVQSERLSRRVINLATLGVTCSLGVALYLIYNAAVSGVWFQSLYSIYLRGDTLGIAHFQLSDKLLQTAANVVQFNFFLFGWPLSLLPVFWWVRQRAPVTALRVACCGALAQCAFYLFFHASHYWYWHEIFIPAALVSAHVLGKALDEGAVTAERARQRVAVAIAGLVCCVLFVIPARVSFYRLFVEARQPFFDGLPQMDGPQLIVVRSVPAARNLPLRRYNGLNDPDLAGPRIFAIARDDRTMEELARAFPDRRIYSYEYDDEEESMQAKFVRPKSPPGAAGGSEP